MENKITKDMIWSIVSLLFAGKVPFKDAQRLIEKYGSWDGPSDLPPDHYTINVRSLKSPTLRDLKKVFKSVHSLWEREYKLKIHPSLRKIKPARGQKIAFLKWFGRHVPTDKVIDWAEEHGYRLAFPCERQAFAKAYPNLGKSEDHDEFYIVDLGSYVQTTTHETGVAVFSRGYLESNAYYGDWRESTHFLLIRK